MYAFQNKKSRIIIPLNFPATDVVTFKLFFPIRYVYRLLQGPLEKFNIFKSTLWEGEGGKKKEHSLYAFEKY